MVDIQTQPAIQGGSLPETAPEPSRSAKALAILVGVGIAYFGLADSHLDLLGDGDRYKTQTEVNAELADQMDADFLQMTPKQKFRMHLLSGRTYEVDDVDRGNGLASWTDPVGIETRATNTDVEVGSNCLRGTAYDLDRGHETRPEVYTTPGDEQYIEVLPVNTAFPTLKVFGLGGIAPLYAMNEETAGVLEANGCEYQMPDWLKSELDPSYEEAEPDAPYKLLPHTGAAIEQDLA